MPVNNSNSDEKEQMKRVSDFIIKAEHALKEMGLWFEVDFKELSWEPDLHGNWRIICNGRALIENKFQIRLDQIKNVGELMATCKRLQRERLSRAEKDIDEAAELIFNS